MTVRTKMGVCCAMIGMLLAMGTQAAGEEARSRSDQFASMRYGIFIHNVYKLTGAPQGMTYTTPDEFANLFDVQAFADQMSAMGVEYVKFTAWHYRMYHLGPNAALDKWLPGHTTKRDLVGEIADALAAKGIALVIYAHPNDGHDFPPEEQVKVGYVTYDKADPKPIPVFNDFINEVYAELAERYSKKPNVLGFWWDSWIQQGNRIDVKRLRETVRAKFSDGVVISNNGAACIDFYCHELNTPQTSDNIDLFLARKENQATTFQGGWWRGDAKGSGKSKFSAETLFRFTVLNAGAGAPGGICWSTSPLADGKTWGTDGEPLQTLVKVGNYLKPIRESVCGVAPSKNWLLPAGTTFSKAPAYVATRSLDGKKEFVHVLKPPAGKSIELAKPVDSFRSAHLLVSGHPVNMEQASAGLVLTLGAEDAWDPLDTVIVLEANAVLKCHTLLPSDPAIEYSPAAQWAQSGDNKWSAQVGAVAEFTFTGTGFRWFGVKGDDHGIAEVAIDGQPAEEADCYSPQRENSALCYGRYDLPLGVHAVRITVSKKLNPAGRGHYVEIQRLEIFENSRQ